MNPPKHCVVRVNDSDLGPSYVNATNVATQVFNIEHAFVFASAWQAEKVAAYLRGIYRNMPEVTVDVVPVRITPSL